MTERPKSKLFRHIEDLHGDRPWGSFLDAGTGVSSLRWVSTLATERWTAVTGAPGDAKLVQDAMQSAQRPQDQVVFGNWSRAELLKGEVFDTVLADYLLGAVDAFAPYFQPYLFARLRPLTGKTFYMTGLEPYVPSDPPQTAAGQLLWNIGRFRDACLLLAGDLPYREYPSGWAVDQLKRAGFAVDHVERFPIGYKASFVNSQIDICTPRLETLPDKALAQTLYARGESLREAALDHIRREGELRHGQNYVIAARPV